MKPQSEARKQRLAKALRANLRRRKKPYPKAARTQDVPAEHAIGAGTSGQAAAPR